MGSDAGRAAHGARQGGLRLERARAGATPAVLHGDRRLCGRRRACLRANLFGAIPVAKATGPIIDRAEAMRYLAEMPWAPDAVLGNPEVTWTDLGEGRYEARALHAFGPGGRAVHAERGGRYRGDDRARPMPGPTARRSRGNGAGATGDYDRVGGRRIPVEAEVGYVDDGTTGAIGAGGSRERRSVDQRIPAGAPCRSQPRGSRPDGRA
jgi:hypothetical protein